MFLLPYAYSKILARRDFLLLSLVIFIGQLATGFLTLSLLVGAFVKTRSNFGVSGVVVSFTLPGFLLIAFSGLIADIFDRKKIIIAANVFISLVVVFLLTQTSVFASIPLSFLYFAGNAFFLPAASAASAQLVSKSELTVANSVFIFTLGAGIIAGIFAAAVVSFFFGHFVTILICEFFLVLAALLSFFLPKLKPSGRNAASGLGRLKDISKAYGLILRRKSVWFSFLSFVFAQALMVFGITLAPGFFDQVVGLPVQKSPIFILPFIGIGVLLGTFFSHKPKITESKMVALGLVFVGIGALSLGFVILSQILSGIILLFPVAIFLVAVGFGDILPLAAGRLGIQRRVGHAYQGTMFGATFILSSLASGVISPTAALIEAIFGYVAILIFGGFSFSVASVLVFYIGKRWRF